MYPKFWPRLIFFKVFWKNVLQKRTSKNTGWNLSFKVKIVQNMPHSTNREYRFDGRILIKAAFLYRIFLALLESESYRRENL